MSAPVLLSIVLNMQAAIQAIAVSGGYFYDVKATSVILNPKPLAAVPTTEVPFLIVGHRVDAVLRNFTGSRPVSIQDRWRVVIEGRIDAPADDTASKLTAFSNFTADLEKALLVDPQRGGLALYTYVQQPIPYMGDDSQSQLYFEQPVEVLLQRAYGSP